MRSSGSLWPTCLVADLLEASKDETRGSRLGLTFFVVATGSVLASLDLFIVNIAFGSISASFPGVQPQQLAWVLNAYGIAFAALLIPFGRLADVVGRKRTFVTGLVVFVVASAVCSIAPGIGVLIAARAVQGAAAAAIIPTSLGLLLTTAPRERHTRLVSVWAATGSIAAALGPTVGGLLVQVDWRFIFLINVVLALPALIVLPRVPSAPGSGGRRPDLLGSLALAAAAALVVWTVSYSSDPDVSLWQLGVGALLAALFAVLFVWRSRRAAVPAVNLQVFGDHGFRAASAGMFFFYAGFGIMLVGAPLVLSGPLGLSPAVAGIAFGAGPAAAVVSTIVAGRLPSTPRTLGLLGGALFALGGLWWTILLTAGGSFWWGYLPGIVLTGLGAGLAQTAFIAGGTAGLPQHEYSAGAGVLNTARQIGSAIGVAVFVALTLGATSSLTGYTGAWAVLTAGGVLAVLAAWAIRDRSAEGGR